MEAVVDVLRKSEVYLARAGLEKPKIDAEWLLAETLGCKRLDLFMQWDHPLDEQQLDALRERVRRRGKREPLQYILGYQDFHDIRVQVRPGVLIPRPETELLVDMIVTRLTDLDEPRIVDLGTGSGAIALALARALPGARILAVERSKEALVQARANADLLRLRDRIAFRSGDWLDQLDMEADCIVSNPPYLTEEEWQSSQPEVRDHEPKEALVAGDEGMADLKRIIQAARERLAPDGLLALETGINHGEQLSSMAESTGYRDVRMEKDDTGRIRFLFARKA